MKITNNLNLKRQIKSDKITKKLVKLKTNSISDENLVFDLRKENIRYCDDLSRDLLKFYGWIDNGFLKKQIKKHARLNLLLKYAKKARQKAEDESCIDGLTGLLNRKAFASQLPGRLSGDIRQGQSSAILILDIDHFKDFNDKYGHLIGGDRVLTQFGQVIKTTIRQSDMVFRWGGEEFIVFLPNTDLKKAMVVAEKIRQIVEKNKFNIIDDEVSSQITVSLGVAATTKMSIFKDTNTSELLDKLTKLADEALYRAKRQGRNRVEQMSVL